MELGELSEPLELADANTAQKADYRANTDNRSDNRCITTKNVMLVNKLLLNPRCLEKHWCVCGISHINY